MTTIIATSFKKEKSMRNKIMILAMLTVLGACKKDCHRADSPQTMAKFTKVNIESEEMLTDIHFSDANNGVLVGTYGFLATTSDGGKSWTRQAKPTDESLLSAFMLDKQELYAARNSLRCSKNGGSSYENITAGLDVENAIRYIHFFSRTNGCILKGSSVYFTKDHGLNWSSKSFYPGRLSRMQVISDQMWYAWGGFSQDGQSVGEMYKTLDGGETWTALLKDSEAQVLAAYFINALTGYYASFDHKIFKTTDGGITWEVVTTYFEDFITDMLFLDEKEGYMTTGDGKLYGTKDGGQRWAVLYETGNSILTRIVVSPDKKVWACGNDGILIRK